MKTSFLKMSFFLLGLVMLTNACEVVEDDPSNPDTTITLNEMDTFGWVYSEIIFNGTGLDANCNNIVVTLSNNTESRDLEIQNCEATSITAFIPVDMPAGMYDVTVVVDGKTFTAVNGTDLSIEVKIRPVILTMSATEIAPEGALTITGQYIINESNNSVYDPTVWLTRPNYTNTVSEITVNAEGTEATIIIDDNLEPGVYNLKLTCIEWSNEVEITIL